MTLALLSHPDCLLHENGPGHPESPERLRAVDDQLIASGLEMVLRPVEAPQATREQLERVHDAAYVETIFAAAPHARRVLLDPDTGMNPHTLSAALYAAGANVAAVDGVMTGSFDAAFCNVRPPGHHATRNRAMGFCIFNNIAVGAAHALAGHELDRVAIVDFDVHHGNGTEHIFRDETRVLFCSTFQHPYYPHTGAETVSDHIVNVPLKAGSNGTAFREAVEDQWLSAIDRFRPELIMVSAGFDAHAQDELAQLMLTEDDYLWISRQIKALADAHAGGRIVSTLEGGYALHALGRSVAAHLKGLLGMDSI